jgi:cysteine desulfurase
MGLRPGTENLPEILKFFSALKSAQKIKEKEAKRLMKLRDYFITKLFSLYQTSDVGNSDVGRPTSGKKFDKATLFINGDLKNRLPNNVNITFPKIPSDLLVIELSARGIMASSRSACKSGGSGSSHVIKAIHPEINSEIGGVRFSLSRQTTRRDIDYTVDALTAILTKLKKWYTPTPI